jgi:uncharacterized protein with PIN domain
VGGRTLSQVTNKHAATFRFYEELNDFLPPERARRDYVYRFDGRPSVKNAIESQGVPHTEIDLILVNGQSVGFDHPLADADRVAVYPTFERLDITPLVRLRERPLRDARFVVDVNLGKLARYLRMLGFDTLYRNDYGDAQIVDIAEDQQRIVLTRDRRLLQHARVTRGYWVRSTDPDDQVVEVVGRLQLERWMRPLHRCLDCNGRLQPVPKAEVLHRLEPMTRRHYSEFYRCEHCGKVFWKGSHYAGIRAKLERLKGP